VVVRRAISGPGFDQFFVALYTLQTLFPYRQKALGRCRTHFLIPEPLYFLPLFQFHYSNLACFKLRRPIPVDSHRQEWPGRNRASQSRSCCSCRRWFRSPSPSHQHRSFRPSQHPHVRCRQVETFAACQARGTVQSFLKAGWPRRSAMQPRNQPPPVMLR
jgi:hypothetical protein